MKKVLCVLLALLIFANFCTPIARAADEKIISVYVDGAKVKFDVQPQIINGRTMVPMRAIFETLGAQVDWDKTEKKITGTKDGVEIIMHINNAEMYVNGETVALDSPPVIINGRTLVPVRAIAESFGIDVKWYGEIRAVSIISGESEVDRSCMTNDYGDVIYVENVLQPALEKCGWYTMDGYRTHDMGILINMLSCTLYYASYCINTGFALEYIEEAGGAVSADAVNSVNDAKNDLKEMIASMTKLRSEIDNKDIIGLLDEAIEEAEKYIDCEVDEFIKIMQAGAMEHDRLTNILTMAEKWNEISEKRLLAYSEFIADPDNA